MKTRLLVITTALIALNGCASNNLDEVSTQRSGSAVERISPVRAAEINTRLGVGYLEQGQLQIAIEKLEDAVRQDPQHAPAFLALGIAYERINQVDRALQHLERAVRLAPDDGSAHNSYATLLCRNEQFELADDHFRRALQDPFYPTPQVVLANAGSCARRNEAYGNAERYLREALTIEPNNEISLFNLAGLFYDQQEYLRARAFLQRLEALSPLDPDSLLLGYNIEQSLGSARDAQRYASALETNFPNTPQASEMRRQNNE